MTDAPSAAPPSAPTPTPSAAAPIGSSSPSPSTLNPSAPSRRASPAPGDRTSGAGKPPAVTSKPVSQPAKNLDDAYAQLDRAASAGEDETPETPPTQPTPGAQPGDPGDADEVPETLPADPGKGTQPPVKAGTLRQLKDAAEKKLVEAQARIKELETASATPKDDPEKKQLGETLAQREKRLQELEDELRFTNYERSTDYKDKYEKPFLDAYEAGRRKVESFKLTNAEGVERPGTAQDFDAFMRITDDNDAAEKAVELFGNKAPLIMYHREQALALNNSRLRAIEDYRQQGGEREKARVDARAKQQGELATLWDTEVKTAFENPKYSSWFKARDGDAEGAELLERGAAFADEAFGKPPKDASGKAVQRSPQELARMHAVVRNKAAAFDYQIHRNQILQKENRAMKKKLAEFESSVPGAANGKGKAGPGLTGWAAIDAELGKRADRR